MCEHPHHSLRENVDNYNQCTAAWSITVSCQKCAMSCVHIYELTLWVSLDIAYWYPSPCTGRCFSLSGQCPWPLSVSDDLYPSPRWVDCGLGPSLMLFWLLTSQVPYADVPRSLNADLPCTNIHTRFRWANFVCTSTLALLLLWWILHWSQNTLYEHH